MQWAAYEPMAPSGMPAMSSMSGMSSMSSMSSQVELPSQQLVPGPQERQQPENQVRKIQAPEMPYVPQQQPQPQAQGVNVPEPKKRKTDLADISESDEPTDLLYVVVAAFIGVVALLILVRAFPEIFGKNLNLLFNRFKMVALLGYVFMLCVVIGVSRYVYSEFLFLQYDWNPLLFTVVTAATQLLHDLVMQYGVINQVARGGNGIIDLLKDYSESGGSRILFGNALLTVVVSFATMLLKGTPVHMIASMAGVAAYILPFALETKNEFSTIS
jgi:hypothetical protein